MSKYKQIYSDIKEKIRNGILKSGNLLESETELSKRYSCSKDTIRKSLSILELEGYIQKFKGKNSIILERGYLKNISLSSIQTAQELNIEENLDIKTDLLSLDIIQGDRNLMKIFDVSEKRDFYKVVRTRSLNGEKLQYDVAYFDRDVVSFLDKDIAKKSIYEYLENTLKLKISHSRRKINFRYATPQEKQNMDLGDFNMVVVIETHAFLSNGNLFQYETISYRPDKFTFSIVAKR